MAKDNGNEELRIGVYVCHCGSNIAGVVDTAAIAEFASKLPGVVRATDPPYACADSGQNIIKEDIKKYNLNRVVVSACSPRMHEPTFRTAVAEVGLNPYLMEMANLREHCSWVHMSQPQEATDKAKDLVRMAVARAARLRAQRELVVSIDNNALVIGGGGAGIQSSLDLANAGYHVYLVEKEPSIGGIMAGLDKTYPTMDCSI